MKTLVIIFNNALKNKIASNHFISSIIPTIRILLNYSRGLFGVTKILFKTNPITILIAVGKDATDIQKLQADHFIVEILSYVCQGYNEREIINDVVNRLGIPLSHNDVVFAINYGLDSDLINVAQIGHDFYMKDLLNISSSSSIPPTPVPATAATPSSPIPSMTPATREPVDQSILSSIGTYVSEHKLLIIGSIAVAAVVGTVIYILWKRRGRTPPTGQESIPSSESDQNSTPSTSDVIAKIVYIVIGLTVVFALYYPLINNNISYVH